MSNTTLRVLIVEDSEDDALLLVRILKKGGYNPVYERVETAAAMKKALEEKQWDIILCDYKMPDFSAPSAISLLKKTNIDIPVIITSGAIGEETAVECMRLGARDYIMKGNLSRLCPAIARELENAEVRNKKKQTESQREVALDLLRESEKYFKEITENSSDIIIITDKNGDIKYCSLSIERYTGYKPEELIGKSTLTIIHPDDKKRAAADYGKAIRATDSAIPNSFRIVCKDGSERCFEGLGKNLLDNPDVAGFIMNVRDITERKRTETILRENEERLRGITQNIPGFIFRFYTKENGGYGMSYASGRLTEYFGGTRDLNEMFPFFFSHVHDEDRDGFLKSIEAAVKNKTAWNFEGRIYTESGEMLWFQGMSTPTHYADQLVFDGIILDITERKQAEEAQRENEKKYRDLYDFLPIPVYEMDLDANITSANRAIYEKFGGAEEDIKKGFKAWQLLTPEAIEKSSRNIQKLLNGAPVIRTEYTLKKLDGSEFPAIVISSLSYINDKPVGLRGAIIDITDRKQAEEALWESVNKYRLLADNIDDVIFVLDLNLIYTYASPSVKTLMGYEPEELLTLRLSDTVMPSSWDMALKTFSKIMKMENSGNRRINTPMMFQLEMKRKDGSTVWTEVRASFIRDENHQPVGIISVSRDITERKQMDEQLRESQQELQTLMDVSPIAICWADLQGNIQYNNRKFRELFGYTVKDIPDIKTWRSLAYPDPAYREQVPPLINLLTEVEKQGKEASSIEVTITCKDGYTRHVLQAGAFTSNRILVTFADITERKQTEEKLQLTLESLRKAIGTTIQVLVSALEARDPYTAGHQSRVADLARAIATEMGLSTNTIEGIRMAGSIHDIGKLSIPAEILSKPTKLTNLEFSLIKEHPQSGYEMLKDVESPWPLAEIVYQHHERMNGTGYPRNLKGDEIIMEARIMAVADVVEAMASHRPYRPSLGIEAALEEIEKNMGILYDAAVADACLKLFREKNYRLP